MTLSEQIYTWLADGKPQSPSDYYIIRQWGEAAEALEAEISRLKEFAAQPPPGENMFTVCCTCGNGMVTCFPPDSVPKCVRCRDK